jgi:hypothetical protein
MSRAHSTLDVLQLADRRIIELCATVCQLSGNPRKVRAEDYAAEVRAEIARLVAEATRHEP